MTDPLVTGPVTYGTFAVPSLLVTDLMLLESQEVCFGGDAGILAVVHCDLPAASTQEEPPNLEKRPTGLCV